jgi:pyrimidine operon attenuation protein / uracil phosphoribosyltransferase
MTPPETTMPNTTQRLDAEALYQTLLGRVRAGLAGVPHPAIVGIHSGGAWLAERLAADLQLQERVGFIDVSFYRDDYARKGLHPEVKPTQIGFDVNGATLLLVDDVLYTGRTTRAAINVLFDYGRPARILLAALADRGGRELPVAADFVGTTLTLQPGQSLALTRDAEGGLALTLEDDQGAEAPSASPPQQAR